VSGPSSAVLYSETARSVPNHSVTAPFFVQHTDRAGEDADPDTSHRLVAKADFIFVLQEGDSDFEQLARLAGDAADFRPSMIYD
jgi:hypothetical protein